VSLLTKRWKVHPPAPDSVRARFPELPPLVLQLLHNRGVHEPDEVESFLGARVVASDPFDLEGMHHAVARIRQAVRDHEPIAVYGDFDADGVTATVLLVQALDALGAQVVPYIPHRVDEGYGLRSAALADLARHGVRLVVTVDCGIRSVKEVESARAEGLAVIVTDHHSVGDVLPPAIAVIDPKRTECPYPFKELAGVGVAFKLAQALLRVERRMRGKDAPPLALGEDDLIDLVAIGTVADVVSLRGENRYLVQRGLARLNPARVEGSPASAGAELATGDALREERAARREQGRADYPSRPGLRALMQIAGLQPGRISSSTIGFVVGPRLNAAGRLESAMLSFNLLRAQCDEDGRKLATNLDDLNRLRQRLTEETLERVGDQIASQADDLLYFAASEDVLPGIAGLVASRLSEAHYRPVVIVEKGEDHSRGSARSVAGFDITAALDRCRHLLVQHGGHAAAAGFTVRTEYISELEHSLKTIAASELSGTDMLPSLSIDAEVELDQLTYADHALLQQFEPCGHGNPTPLLASRGVEVLECRGVGSKGQHLKLALRDGARIWDAIAFRQGGWTSGMPQRVDIAYLLELNEWDGRQRLQLNVQDLRPSEQ
jgi:single-stranded-DNA-specific exonuclease